MVTGVVKTLVRTRSYSRWTMPSLPVTRSGSWMAVTRSAVVRAVTPGGATGVAWPAASRTGAARPITAAEGDEDEQAKAGHGAPPAAGIGPRPTPAPSIAPSPPRCRDRDGHHGPVNLRSRRSGRTRCPGCARPPPPAASLRSPAPVDPGGCRGHSRWPRRSARSGRGWPGPRSPRENPSNSPVVNPGASAACGNGLPWARTASGIGRSGEAATASRITALSAPQSQRLDIAVARNRDDLVRAEPLD